MNGAGTPLACADGTQLVTWPGTSYLGAFAAWLPARVMRSSGRYHGEVCAGDVLVTTPMTGTGGQAYT